MGEAGKGEAEGTPAGGRDGGQPMAGTPLYQLVARGRRHPDVGVDGSVTTHSRKVFGSPEAAEAHAPEFRAACAAPQSPCDMHYMDPADITIRTVTLELAG